MGLRFWWAILRTLVMLFCVAYWAEEAMKHIWPAGLFTVAWVIFFVEGTRNEIKAIKNGK